VDAIEALTQKVSVPKLTGPAPTPSQLSTMFAAALRAPDHARLTPWQYWVVEGNAKLKQLGEKMLEGALADEPEMTEEKQQKILNNPLRAPLMVLAVAKQIENEKVPNIEQLLSVGAGIQNFQTAAWALGFASIWRTGALAYSRSVHKAIGLEDSEQIVGFIYIGHPDCKVKAPPVRDVTDFVRDWSPN
jgi:nitroreductase